jgi:hypothetical protein
MSGGTGLDQLQAARLDPENPWPGLDAFEEAARDYFHGRDAEAAELLRRVAEAPLVVLFGKSGLGKTSLLKAGLFPRLRAQQFLPVYVRLDFRAEAPPLMAQVAAALRSALEAHRVDAPPMPPAETLWEYLHRADLEIWSDRNYPLTPVLVCDQFEELFTLGDRVPAAVAAFAEDFADLAENRIPASLEARLARESGAHGLDLRERRYKVVVSLREDFLPDLEGWRRSIPSLGKVRVRLLRVEERQGTQRVELTHDLLTRAVREHRDWRRAEETRAALARQAEEERAAFEAQARQRELQLEQERRAERERRLEAEVRGARRIKRVVAALVLALMAAVVMTGVAWKQRQYARDEARQAREQKAAAEAAREEADTQRQLAQERLERIINGIRMKEAMLSGDRARIDAVLARGPLNTSIAFAASAQSLGYRNPANQLIHRFAMYPDPASLPAGDQAVAAVTYTLDHPTFKNNKMIAGPERAFTAVYDGWGCVTRVVALIEYVDPNRSPEVASFDLCRLIGW